MLKLLRAAFVEESVASRYRKLSEISAEYEPLLKQWTSEIMVTHGLSDDHQVTAEEGALIVDELFKRARRAGLC